MRGRRGKSLNLLVYTLIAYGVTAVAAFTLSDYLSANAWVNKHILYNYGGFYYAGLGMLLILLYVGAFRIVARNVNYVGDGQSFLRPQHISIDETGITETSDLGHSFRGWKGVTRIEKSKYLLLLYIDQLQAYVLPLRSFASTEQADAFHRQALAWWQAGRAPESLAAVC